MKKNCIICPTCGSIMIKRTGYFGEFYGCIKYPNCTTTVSMGDIEEKFNKATNFQDGEHYGRCKRCAGLGTLSSAGFCSYCQNLWDKD